MLPSVDRVIVPIVSEHCKKYDADIVIKQALGDDVEICLLEDFTSSQSETIALTIKKMDVQGGFVAKDSDGYVKVLIEEFDNFLVGADLKKHLELSNIAGKSFIVLNEQNIIIDIVEKSVCSNIVNIGVYGFRSAEEFIKVQEIVKRTWDQGKGEIYLSHIASYMIGQKNYFAYKEAVEYEDWGLVSDWHRALNRRKAFFVDVDGVVFKNKGHYGRINWDSPDEPLERNVKTLKNLSEDGSQIIFCTARPKAYREKLENSLKSLGISWHCIVMECNHSQRVIINDYANTNPYPSCKAINIQRDNDDLGQFIREGQ